MRGNATVARRVSTAALVLLMTAGLVSVATPAQAAVDFDVRPLSWDVIGLDSNNVNVGPNLYEVGARACNNSTNPDNAAPLSTVKATLVWDGPGVNALSGSTALPAGANEVDTLTLSGGAAGDILVLQMEGNNSPLTMPAGGHTNATAGQVETAIEAFPQFAGQSASIAVTGVNGGPFTITFSGGLGNTDIPAILVKAAANEVNTLTVSAGKGNDLLAVIYKGVSRSLTIPNGGPNPYQNITAAQVDTMVSGFSDFSGAPAGDITVTKAIVGTDAVFTITFSGTLGNQDIADILFHADPAPTPTSDATVIATVSETTKGSTQAPSTGSAAGTMVTTTQGNGADNWVHIQTGTDRTEVIHGLAPNECFDFYFNVEVIRATDSYFWTRPYHILVQNCPGDVCAPIRDFYSTPSTVPPDLNGQPGPYVNSPNNRQIYVEKILSQNRNYVAQSTGGACPTCGLYFNSATQPFVDPDGPGVGTDLTGTRVPNNPTSNLLKVGQEYKFTLVAQTATNGYGSWSAQVNWPRGIFQILDVRTQLQRYPDPVNPIACCYEDSDPYAWPNTNLVQPTPNPPSCGSQAAPGTYGCNGVIAQTWADAGGFCEVVPLPGNIGCTSPANVTATSGNTIAYRALDPAAGQEDTAGNLVYMTFNLRVVKIGSGGISAQVWDGSGSSYHYNGDFNNAQNFYTFCASNSGTDPNCTADTAVTFESASATSTPSGGVLRWKTGAETDNLGFNVYRKEGNRKVKLNDEPIAGSALSDGGSVPGSGNSYGWVDRGKPPKAYWIEALDLDGSSQWKGPVKVRGWSSKAPARPSPSISSLSPSDAPQSGETVPRSANLEGVSLPDSPTAVPFGAVKISVDREGWYRVPLKALAANGVNVRYPGRLRLYAEGVEQPLLLRNGAVEFYGLGLDTRQTDTRVYWISSRTSKGAKRIVQLPPADGGDAPTYFMSTSQRRDKGIYWSSLANGEASNFFGAVVGASPVAQTVNVRHLEAGPGATLDVALQGVSRSDHAVSVDLNGSPVGKVEFKNRDRGVISVPADNLVEGTNTVTLSSPGWSDLSLVESIGITYPRAYVSDGGALRFTAPGGSGFSVKGFSASGVRIVDVTDPAAPTELAVATSPDGTGGYAASATAPGTGTRTLYAFVSGAAPASVTRAVPSGSLATSSPTDMLIVAGSGLDGSVAPLAKLHKSEGLATRVIPIGRVYDQFSYGERDVRALENFIAFAESKWTPAPRYLLLAGDASHDPRGYSGPKGVTADVVPTAMVDTHVGEIASDASFADLDGDLRPDVALGRLPVGTQAEADAMVAKIVSYAAGPKNGDSVIAAGAPQADDTFHFAGAAQESAAMTPPGGVGTVVNSVEPNATERLIQAMNAGPSIVGYYGHGNVDVWGGGFFSAKDVPSLTNTGHPFFFAPMTCYNAYFTSPNLDSLSEALLKSQGGAVAAYASSGATEPEPQKVLADGLFDYLSSSPSPVIGDAVLAASAQAPTDSRSAREVLVTWTLLGDPAMRLR